MVSNSVLHYAANFMALTLILLPGLCCGCRGLRHSFIPQRSYGMRDGRYRMRVGHYEIRFGTAE